MPRKKGHMAGIALRGPRWYEGKKREEAEKAMTEDSNRLYNFLITETPKPVFMTVLDGLNRAMMAEYKAMEEAKAQDTANVAEDETAG
jgi:hypothetical protein